MAVTDDEPAAAPRRLRPPISADQRLLADALVDRQALRELLARQPSEATFELIARHRLAPLVARLAADLDAPAPLADRLRLELNTVRVRWTLFEHELGAIGTVLGAIGIPWLPLKGGDLAFRVYDRPDDRVASDLDVLVSEADFQPALAALLRDGWRSLHPDDPRILRYVLEEGHNWPLARGPVALELHLRLWGRAADGMAGEILAAADPAPDLGVTARRALLEHALAVAGVHAWMVFRPRPVATWLDVERIARFGNADLGDRVVEASRRWGLDLPVGMAAAVADALWPNPTAAAICDRLLRPLPPSERLVPRRLTAVGPDGVDDRLIVLASLLAGRPSRLGWRSIWRRLRPHRGVRVARTLNRLANRQRPR